MKREWISAAVLLLLMAAALISLARLDRLVRQMEEDLDAAQQLSAEGRLSDAADAVERAAARWTAARVFLRAAVQSRERDAVSDRLFELRQLLAEQNAAGIPSAFYRLLYDLHSLLETERVLPGNLL